jgi:putative phosphonate metabolism protein
MTAVTGAQHCPVTVHDMQMKMKRYAVYYAPGPGRFAAAGACWLGWDPAAGAPVAQPADIAGLGRLTAEPRKYGLHGTLKPPFRLAPGVTLADLQADLTRLSARLAPVVLPGLTLARLGGFLALVPVGDAGALTGLAAEVVVTLDGARAPLTDAEIARRSPDRLTPRQADLLRLYGYPWVMEQFRFHLTLSGPLTEDEGSELWLRARRHFADCTPTPFVVDALSLFGEAEEDGRFHLLHRYPLTL